MTSTQLEYFVQVAKAGSFTVAAKHCYISQPALSKQIQSLEEELNTKLFVRNSNGVLLTDDGRKLFSEAEEIIQRIKAIPGKLTKLHDTVSGELNILCGQLLAHNILPPLLKRLLERYPGISPRIHATASVGTHADTITAGYADIGLGNAWRPDPRLVYHTMFYSRLELIRSRQSPLAEKKRVTKEEIAKDKLICYPPESNIHAVIRNLLDPLPMNVFMTVYSSATIIDLVRENFGIGFVPDYLISPAQQAGLVIGGYEVAEKLPIAYYYNPARPMLPQARAFISIIREYYNLGL